MMSTMPDENKQELKKTSIFSNYIVRDLILWFTFIFILPIVLFVIYTLTKQPAQIKENFSWLKRPLQKIILDNSNAVCNDGSRAGYYLRQTESKVWTIVLEGGFYCYDHSSCSQRNLDSYNLTTSLMNKNFKFSTGIFSSDPDKNPNWSNINVVEIPYCSSDLWTGRTKSDEFHFMGYEIISAVFDDLMEKTTLNDSELVILAGVSAGGIGVLMNANRIENFLSLHAPRSKLKLVIDSSWQLDLPYSYLCSGSNCLMGEFFTNAINYWNAQIPQECARKENGSLWNCFLPKNILSFINIPVFVIQSKFDETQILEQFNYIKNFKSNKIAETFELMDKKLSEQIKNADSFFVPSCIDHIALTNKDWNAYKVDGITMSEALIQWAFENKKIKLYDTCKWPDCHGTCPSIKNPETNKQINPFDYLAYLGLVDRNQIARKYKLNLRYLQNLSYFKLMKIIMN